MHPEAGNESHLFFTCILGSSHSSLYTSYKDEVTDRFLTLKKNNVKNQILKTEYL